MKTAIVSNEDEAKAAIEQAAAEDLRLAAISNAGLSKGQARLTFLPSSAFADSGNQGFSPAADPVLAKAEEKRARKRAKARALLAKLNGRS